MNQRRGTNDWDDDDDEGDLLTGKYISQGTDEEATDQKNKTLSCWVGGLSSGGWGGKRISCWSTTEL